MNLEKNLRYFREKEGYKTAKEFADSLDVPYNTYTAYENQKREPKIEMLIKIADLLNVSLDDLVGRTNNSIKEKKINLLKNKILNIFKHSNDKYFSISSINSGYITFTIKDDTDKLTDVEFRTKDFIALIEMVENHHAKKIKEDIYDLASKIILQDAIVNTKRDIDKIKNDNLNTNKDKDIIEKSTLIYQLYKIDKEIQKQIDDTKKDK